MSEPDTHASTPNTAAANAEPPIVKVVQDIPVVFVDGVTQHITAPGILAYQSFIYIGVMQTQKIQPHSPIWRLFR
jgi:hypothetical protein